MPQQPEDQPLFPVRRAFVVQFSAATAVEPARFAGRVEHVVSGQAAPFNSLEELLTFLVQMLRTHATALEAPLEPGGQNNDGRV
jgi:hypothetical protein